MKERAVLAVIMITIGIVLGYSAWRRHRQLAGQRRYHLIRVPPWLSWLCGRPLQDNQIELEFIIFQLFNLLCTLLWAPLLIELRVNNLLALVLITAYLMLVSIVPFAVHSILNLIDLCKRRVH